MSTLDLSTLLDEYARALRHTDDLVSDLSAEEIAWRPDAESSAIGWHLGHQPAVAHYLVRNLTAAEPAIDVDLDRLMDSATPERQRGDLPDLARLWDYRNAVAERVRFRIGQIDEGKVGAPNQLRAIASTLLVAVINHEYQHDKWIGEVRVDQHGRELPPDPTSDHLRPIDGYVTIGLG